MTFIVIVSTDKPTSQPANQTDMLRYTFASKYSISQAIIIDGTVLVNEQPFNRYYQYESVCEERPKRARDDKDIELIFFWIHFKQSYWSSLSWEKKWRKNRAIMPKKASYTKIFTPPWVIVGDWYTHCVLHSALFIFKQKTPHQNVVISTFSILNSDLMNVANDQKLNIRRQRQRLVNCMQLKLYAIATKINNL